MNLNVDLPSDPWAIGIYIAIAIFVLMPAFAMLTAVGFWTLAKIAPLRWLMLAWGKVLAEPGRKWLSLIVREETADIRGQVFPNGGSSMNDHLRLVLFELHERSNAEVRVDQDFGAFEAVLLELRARMQDISEKVYDIDARTSTDSKEGGEDAKPLRTGGGDPPETSRRS